MDVLPSWQGSAVSFLGIHLVTTCAIYGVCNDTGCDRWGFLWVISRGCRFRSGMYGVAAFFF